MRYKLISIFLGLILLTIVTDVFEARVLAANYSLARKYRENLSTTDTVNEFNISVSAKPITLSSNPALKNFTLENGLSVLIKEDHNHELVAIEVLVKTGSLYEGQWLGSGLAHLVEHMVFKGTKTQPTGSIEDQIKNLGGSINGYTSYEFTGYNLILPAKNFTAGLEIIADMLQNPLFDIDELAKEKDVILNEISMHNDDPDHYLQRKFFEQAYAIEPYNLPIIGNEKLLIQLKQQDVIEFYKKWYIPNNIILAIAGDIKAIEAEKTVQSFFNGFKMQNYPDKHIPKIPAFTSGRTYEEEIAINSSYLMLGFESVELTHADAVCLDVLSVILAQGKDSLLYKHLVQEKNLLDSLSAYNFTPGFRGVFVIKGIFDYKNRAAILAAIFSDIETLKKNKINRKTLEKAKNLYLAEYIFDKEPIAYQAKTLATDFVYTKDPGFTKKYIDLLQKVCADDIQRCAQQYLKSEKLITVILKPKSSDYKTSTEKRVSDERNNQVKLIKLSPGIKIILKQDHNLPIINFYACFGGGTRFENENNNGLFCLLSKLLQSGTKKRSAIEIAEFFENIGAQIKPFNGYNSFGLGLKIMHKDLKESLETLTDLILNSNFPEKQLDTEKRLILKDLERQQDDIFQNTLNILKQTLFSNLPYRFNTLGAKESVGKLDRAILVKNAHEFICADNLVLAVFGDFDDADENYIIQLLENKLKKMPFKSKKTKLEFREQKLTSQKIVQNRQEKEQAVLMLGFKGVNVYHEDRYVLECINELLSSPGSALYKRIREEYGLSYTLGGASINGLDSGYFFIYVATKSEFIDEIRKIIDEEITKIVQQSISEEKLTQVKNYLIGNKMVDLQTNQNLAFVCALDELYGLGFEYYKKYESAIMSITPEQIIQIAQKYLKSEQSVLIITKDE
ncbi:MAG: pitrilysin family protein [Candidatus Omnitrophota bacterium]